MNVQVLLSISINMEENYTKISYLHDKKNESCIHNLFPLPHPFAHHLSPCPLCKRHRLGHLQTCKKLAARDQDLDCSFCVKSLGSDLESHEINLEGLELIELKILQANMTGTIKHIKQLLKQKLKTSLLKALSKIENKPT